jgi:hypothetical protein
MQWTEEQISALAPDDSSLKAGRNLAKTNQWLNVQQSERALWGECQGSGKDPYRAAIDLTNLAFKCSCPSKKFPCKHGLGLFLLFARQSNAFAIREETEWVNEWLNKRNAKQQQKTENKPVDEKAKAKRIDARLKKVNAGIEEVQLWLKDLIRNGLIGIPEKNENFWDTAAARMTDAQASGLAGMIRNIGEINFFAGKWQGELLEKLTKIFLLTEGYKNIDQLPENLQFDIKNLIGWSQSQDELKTKEGIKDIWLILGKQEEVEDKLIVQRNWLYGLKSKQYALVLNFTFQTQQKDVSLLVGTAIEAELVFFQSNYPQRAIIKNRFSSQEMESPKFLKNWTEVNDLQANVLSQNPWVERLPLLVGNITPIYYEDSWILKDVNNQYVTVSPYKDAILWELLACSGGKPLDLFLLKENDTYTPFGFWNEGKYVALSSSEAQD